MITEQDLIDYSELTSEEIEVIAEIENEPVVLCVAHAQMLLHQDMGVQTIKQYLIDALSNAKAKGQQNHIVQLEKILIEFEKAHP